MADIQTAFNYVIQACSDPYIGYSQGVKRKTITLGVNYNTYCDCSSLMSWALTRAGYFSVNPWFTTANEESKLLGLGFTRYNSNSVTWQAGDILLKPRSDGVGHTEMVYKSIGTGGYTMGAHNSSRAFTDQVSINTFASYPSSYRYLFRAPGSTPALTYAWYQSNAYLADLSDEQYGNAVLITIYLTDKGWSEAAVAGLLGNMIQESTINPGIWQGLDDTDTSGGYGLVQWTPAINKYYGYALQNNIDMTDADVNGPAQLQYLIDTHSAEYFPTTAYPQTWAEFIVMQDPADAASVFMHNYERPASYQHEQERRDWADYWYNEIINNFPSDAGINTPNNYYWLPGFIWDLRRRKIIP